LSRLLAARDDQGTGGMTDRQLRDEVVTLVGFDHLAWFVDQAR
jgi:hypothetical protein